MSEDERRDERPPLGSEKPSEQDEGSGYGPILGVVFAIALTGLALWLVQQMRDSASMLNCAFTKDPKCRAMIRD